MVTRWLGVKCAHRGVASMHGTPQLASCTGGLPRQVQRGFSQRSYCAGAKCGRVAVQWREQLRDGGSRDGGR
jgi:hypothetical protein